MTSRLGWYLWVVVVFDAIAVAVSVFSSALRGAYMLPAALGTPILVLALARIVMRGARWSQVALVWVVAWSIPMWFSLSPEDFSITGILAMVYLILYYFGVLVVMKAAALLLNLAILIKLTGWKKGPVLALAAGGLALLVSVYVSHYPVGFGPVTGRVQVTHDPIAVHWSRNSRFLLYMHSEEMERGPRHNTLSVLDVTTGYQRRYELPGSSDVMYSFEVSPDSISVVFQGDHYSARGGYSNSLYTLDLRSGKTGRFHFLGWIPNLRARQPADNPDHEVSPNGAYYYRIEHRGGGDWYNSEPSPLWLGKVTKPT
jgi:hypothetical protein